MVLQHSVQFPHSRPGTGARGDAGARERGAARVDEKIDIVQN